jgi:hypothetical protein
MKHNMLELKLHTKLQKTTFKSPEPKKSSISGPEISNATGSSICLVCNKEQKREYKDRISFYMKNPLKVLISIIL